mmetsp:Transcript_31533/g.69533  ORF Transcript_31533/g.69533 Transcript_31533/m.69533 type:complete len:347 (-) Transcript_31533:38-1078(-)
MARRSPARIPMWLGIVLLPKLSLSATVFELGENQGPIEVRIDLPTPSEFYQDYILAEGKVGKPVLFRGAAKKMPAYSLWTDDYLRNTHGKTILDQVETEKDETRTVFPHDDWNLAKFLDNYNTSDIYSTAQTPKGLSNEVYLLPPITCGGYSRKLSATVLWFSSGGTKSVIHSDAQQNIHCMFAGEKRWIAWRPDSSIDTKAMGWVKDAEALSKKDPKFKNAYGAFAGHIKALNVDTERFPGWKTLKSWQWTLEAGDCMYLPPRWFHYVEAPAQRAISVHVWFQAPSKFDEKGCKKLEDAGYNLSEYLLRVGDCTWGYGEDESVKQTKCKLSRDTLKGGKQRGEDL